MLVSAIIPCHGGVEDTRECVRALQAQRAAPPLEIIVVDNASPDATGGLDREFPGVRVVRLPRNRGFAGGVNAGLRAARGDHLLVINNDTRAAPGLVARLVRALESDAGIGAVAPVSNHVKGAARIEIGGAGASPEGGAEIEAMLDQHCAGKLQDVLTLSGLCFLLTRRVLDRVGLLDERFGIGTFEDDDFSLRLRLLGERLVLVRDAFLHHHGHRTFQALGQTLKEVMQDKRELFEQKWRPHAAGRAAIALMRGHSGLAAEHATAALRETPRWPDAHWIVGWRAANTGAVDVAQAHLGAFIAACPQHGEARVLLALAQLRSGDAGGRARLATALRECFFTEAEAADAIGGLAKVLVVTGSPTEALAPLANALELAPEHGQLLNLRGAALLELGRVGEALPCFERAHEVGCLEAATNIGVCHWRLGRRREGLEQLHRAVQDAPQDPAAQRNLAAALSELREAGVVTPT